MIHKKEYQKQYRLNNKEYFKKYMKQYYLHNKEKMNEQRRKNHLINKERDKEYRKEYYQKNKKTIQKKSREYRLNNKESYLKWLSIWQKEKLKTDPNFKIKRNLRKRIWNVLKGKKIKTTLELIGCSVEELWNYLEKQFKPGMTRENYGLWHVDHIKPCASFDLTKPEEQIKCFHYTNLQPLWAAENLSQGAKYEMD